MALPTDPPSVYDRGREVWNVAQVIAKRPETFGPRARKPGQADDVWFTNVAYWSTYPEAPFEVNPAAPAQAAAWLRIQDDVRKALALPQDAPPATPTDPPSLKDRALEVWNVSQVAVNKPATYKAQARKPGQADDEWYTNVAYWMTYPGAPVEVDVKVPAQVAAWLRIREDVRQALYIQKNPQPWIMTKPTWPLASAPKKWKAGSAFKAKRPWNGPQTRYHAGTDLAAVAGAAVLAPEAGTVVAPNSGWEFDPVTNKGVKAIILRTDSGRTILLGGIRPGSATVAAGARVTAGQKIAEVGRYPGGDSMLHVQLYDSPLTEQQVNGLKSWRLGEPQPKYLVDAGPYLTAAMTNPKFVAVLAEPLDEEIEGGEEAEGTVAGDATSADTAPPPSGGSSGSSGSSGSAPTTNASPVTVVAIVLAAIGVGTFLFR